METVIVSRETAPANDVQLMKLINIFEHCRKSQDCAYLPCPDKERCVRLYDKICELSAIHPLTIEQSTLYYKIISKFVVLRENKYV